jgi:hypothetical protein
MPNERELKGVLFFSKQHPHITGYLVIDGIEYELAGWHANDIRAEIKARARNADPDDQMELINEGPGGPGSRQRD